MPTYQYACTECGQQLEVVQKFTDDPLTVCPSCQGRLRKLFSAVGVVFKGSGFYKTDSRSSTPAAKKSGDASSSPAKTDGTASTAESPSAPASASGGTAAGSGSAASGDGSKVA